MSNYRIILSTLLLLLSSLAFCFIGYTSESQTLQDTNRLLETSNRLMILNQDSQKRLESLEKRLLTSEERSERISQLLNLSTQRLALSEEKLKKVEMRLSLSEETSENQKVSLKNLNSSFKEYSKEQKKKINELKLQRAGLIGLLIIALASK